MDPKSENGIIISVVSNNVKSYIHEIKLKNHHKPKRKKYCCLCRSQANSLLLILGAYITIFSVASIILVISVLKLQNVSDSDKFSFNVQTSEDVYKSKYKSVLSQIDNLFYKRFFKEFMWPYKSSGFNCSNLNYIKKFNYLTSGWSKNVFSFEHDGKNFALKTVNVDGIEMKNCTEKNSLKFCVEKASFKMYKEYILSQELTHPNIIKVLAWCMSSTNMSNDVAIITELCSPINTISLLRMSFYQRLKIMLDLSQLMVYLSDTPLGSVALNDFQKQQFVLCGNNLKLTDLDDLSVEEPKCSTGSHCMLKKLFESKSGEKFSIKLNCANGVCLGYNEKQNIINTYKHFVNLFLNITTPEELRHDVDDLFYTYTSTWNAIEVFKKTDLLYKKYNILRQKNFKEQNNFT